MDPLQSEMVPLLAQTMEENKSLRLILVTVVSLSCVRLRMRLVWYLQMRTGRRGLIVLLCFWLLEKVLSDADAVRLW